MSGENLVKFLLGTLDRVREEAVTEKVTVVINLAAGNGQRGTQIVGGNVAGHLKYTLVSHMRYDTVFARPWYFGCGWRGASDDAIYSSRFARVLQFQSVTYAEELADAALLLGGLDRLDRHGGPAQSSPGTARRSDKVLVTERLFVCPRVPSLRFPGHYQDVNDRSGEATQPPRGRWRLRGWW